jgi:hypothetical protein
MTKKRGVPVGKVGMTKSATVAMPFSSAVVVARTSE